MLGSLRLAAGLALLGLALGATPAGAEEAAITIPGSPLSVSIGPLGQCQSSYSGHGNNYGGSATIGECGFFLAFPNVAGQPEKLKGTTFGSVPGHTGLSLYEAVPDARGPVTGSGTAANPYSQRTDVIVRDSGNNEDAVITETTTYVNGAPQFTSTYSVRNVSGGNLFFRAIYAGHLLAAGGTKEVGAFLKGPPRFVGAQNAAAGVLGGFQEAPLPAPQWSHFEESSLPKLWTTLGSSVNEGQAFKDAIETAEGESGAGVEWDQRLTTPLPAARPLPSEEEQAFTIINRAQIPAGLQVSPAARTLKRGQTETVALTALDTGGQPFAGRSVRYTVAGANPQAGSVKLNTAGQTQISYVGKNAGIDTIRMFVDLAGTGTQTAGDPAGTATATFAPAPRTPNSGYRVQAIHANSNGTVTITFVPTQAGRAVLAVTVPTATIARREALAAKKAKGCRKGQIKIKGRCRPKTTVTGQASARGTAGVALKLTVNPSTKIKALLKKGRTVHLTATLTYSSSLGGKPTVRVFHLTVKGKKPKPHQH
jgi:hypothetical protein